MKTALFSLLLFIAGTAQAEFGPFRTAISLQNNGTTTTYNLLDNAIGTANFQGTNLGAFVAGAGNLQLIGTEAHTFKNNGGNVCGAELKYAIYPTGNRPGIPLIQTLATNFAENCPGSAFTTGKSCSGSDQRWQITLATPLDLTAGLTTGNYTLEVYHSVPGESTGGGCSEVRFASNGGVNYTATFTITGVLPLRFTDARVTGDGNTRRITWTTADEKGVDFFEIHRALEGNSFEIVGRQSARNSAAEQYAFTDALRSSGRVLYKIVAIDRDGKRQESPQLSIFTLSTGAMQVVPNPSKGVFAVVPADLPAGAYTARVLDVNGKEVHAQKLQHTEGARHPFRLSALPAGNYVLQITNGQTTFQKVLLIH